MGDDDTAIGAGGVLGQGAGNEFVGEAVEAIALDTFGGDRARQTKHLGNFRLAAVEGGIKAGHLRHIRQQRLQRDNAGDVMRLVEWGEWGEACEMGENLGVDDRRLRIAVAAMYYAMADCGNFPAGIGGREPFEQRVKCLCVADAFAAQYLVGNAFASPIFGDHFGFFSTDAVDLAGHFGNRRNWVVKQKRLNNLNRNGASSSLGCLCE